MGSRLLGQLGLTVASAVLYGAAFPPHALWPAGWFALVPLLCALAGVGTWRALVLGWVWTMALSATVIRWFGSDVAAYFGQSPWFGSALFVLVPTITGAIDYMAFAAFFAYSYRATGRVRPLLVGAAWVAAELGRTKLFFGNPWELAAYSQVDAGPLVQIADLTGIYGVSFVLAAFNAGAAGIVLARVTRRPARAAPAEVRGALVAVSIVGLAMGIGGWRQSQEAHRPPDASSPPRKKVVAVQGNVNVGTQWRREYYGRNLDVYLGLTGNALEGGTPAVAFWPENAMTFFVEAEKPYRHAIARSLRSSGSQLVSGGARSGHPSKGSFPPFFNSAFLIGLDGSIGAHYDKEHLIPFAERFPFVSDEEIVRRFARVREFTAGQAIAPLPTLAGAVGVLICNEALFPEPASARVGAGAEYLAVLANDGWSDDPQYGTTALAMARLRAIEQRRWVVRSSTSGPSAVIDPMGLVVAAVPPGAPGSASALLEPRREITPYARWGDWFAWACLVVVAAWSFAAAPATRKASSSVDASEALPVEGRGSAGGVPSADS